MGDDVIQRGLQDRLGLEIVTLKIQGRPQPDTPQLGQVVFDTPELKRDIMNRASLRDRPDQSRPAQARQVVGQPGASRKRLACARPRRSFQIADDLGPKQ